MNALALALYLVVLYLLPLAPPALYEWVWRTAPVHFPHLVAYSHGRMEFNGAFYLEMWLWWLLFSAVGSLLEWLARRDDPQWLGLSAGFARGSRLAGVDALLLIFFVVLVFYCRAHGYPTHGPISAGIATASLLIGGPLLGVISRVRSALQAPHPDAAPLNDAIPRAISSQEIARRVRGGRLTR